MPVPRLFFSLTAEPVPSLSPGNWSPFLAGSLMTLGSILSKVFSGNFIAYFARSVVLSDRDCAQTCDARMARSAAPKTSGTFVPSAGTRSIPVRSSLFCKTFRSIYQEEFDKYAEFLTHDSRLRAFNHF